MNDHTTIRELISAFVDRETSAEENNFVNKHLSECVACKQYYDELKKLSLSLRNWKDEKPSPDLEQKLKERKKREDFSMENITKFINMKVAGGILVGVLAVVVGNQVYNQRELSIPMRQPVIRTKGQPTVQTGTQNAPSVQPVRTETPVSAPESKAIQKSAWLTRENTDSTYKPEIMAMMSQGMSMRESLVGGIIDYGTAPPPVQYQQDGPFNTENYNRINENAFLEVTINPLSTFSIDVDTASYSNVRRFLNQDQMPPKDAVRIEEMINYFTYDYPKPQGDEPFSISTEIGASPWNSGNKILLVGLQGKQPAVEKLPPSNLVFLIDVSGSMEDPNKLPLLIKGFKMLTNQLRPVDRVAIVTYAGNAGLALPSTLGSDKETILQALDNLHAGGSTAGGAGIKLAYKIAKENFVKDGNNRVILATDGDFNIGVSSDSEMVRLIEEKRESGILITVLGFGTENLKDSKMEQIANKGNGNYFYVDSLQEAKKVLVQELGSTLFTIAKDVKIQIEFNPALVKSYRLIGYENRMLAKEDFNNDKKDAGELGAGHTVTALYEIVQVGAKQEVLPVDQLKYQESKVKDSDEFLTIKLRYKEPNASESKLIAKSLSKNDASATAVSQNLKFASAVAEFGMLLRNSEHKGSASYKHVLTAATEVKGNDAAGYRSEFIKLVEKAQSIDETSGKGIQFKGAEQASQ